MPSVSSGKVLVTGANGYIGIWVVQHLLQHGYSVRGTVRSESKAKHIRKTFASYGDKLELVIVPDITKEGAFDEAVKGVDVIEHTASPVTKVDDPDELIAPAVHGTLRVLESALVYGPSIKRILVTSSLAAVLTLDFTASPRMFSETDWNDAAVTVTREKGRDALSVYKYCASKVLAERAAWEFVDAHKSEIGWDLVTLQPSYVYGPVLHEVSTPETLNGSMKNWFQSVFRNSLDVKELGVQGGDWVDVRDLAEAHVLAIEKEKAGGERLIISEGPCMWQDWVNAVRKSGADAPLGDESYDPAKAIHRFPSDNAKAIKILGIRYRSLEESAADVVKDFSARGWISAAR